MGGHAKGSDAARRAQAVAAVHQALALLEEWWVSIEITVSSISENGIVEGYSLEKSDDPSEDEDD